MGEERRGEREQCREMSKRGRRIRRERGQGLVGRERERGIGTRKEWGRERGGKERMKVMEGEGEREVEREGEEWVRGKEREIRGTKVGSQRRGEREGENCN